MKHSVLLCFFFLLPNSDNAAPLGTTYMITDPREGAGFFSTFHDVIGALDFYDREKEKNPTNNIGCVVDFEDKGLFFDEMHGENWWNYYFKPIWLGNLRGIPYKFPAYKKAVLAFQAEFGLSRERYAELIKKYVSLEPLLQQEIDTFIEEHFKDSYVIGVHYRGTDKENEASTLAYKAVCDRIENDLISLDCDSMKIFIATDEEKFLQYAKERFLGKVISSNAIRSEDKEPVHFSQVGTPYQRGKDAVIDCWLLSRCSILYKMASNLSDAAKNMNPNMSVVHLNTGYFEETASDGYGMVKPLNAILALLDRYEKQEIKGVRAFFPTKEGGDYAADVNWWDYYFESLELGNNDDFKPMPSWYLFNIAITSLFEMPRERSDELWKKYIRPKEEIVAKIDNFIRPLLHPEHSLIGVHYYKQPGQMPSYSLVLKQLKDEIACNPDQQLLMVTNDNEFFKLVCAQYPDVRYYYQPAVEEEQASINNLEEEKCTLIDAILLSKTDKVIGTASIILKLATQFNAQLDVQTIDEVWRNHRLVRYFYHSCVDYDQISILGTVLKNGFSRTKKGQ